MAWVRLDDQVPTHPKILQVGPAAAWLWVCGIAYCSRHLTDGAIPATALATFGVPKVKALADRLVTVGLWMRSTSGFVVHDFHDFNPSADVVRTRRREAAQRVAKWKSRQALRPSGNALLVHSENAALHAKQRESNAPPTPTPTPTPIPPYSPPEGAIPMRPSQLRKRAEDIRAKAWGRCRHDPACPSYDACIARLVDELRESQVEAFDEVVSA